MSVVDPDRARSTRRESTPALTASVEPCYNLLVRANSQGDRMPTYKITNGPLTVVGRVIGAANGVEAIKLALIGAASVNRDATMLVAERIEPTRCTRQTVCATCPRTIGIKERSTAFQGKVYCKFCTVLVREMA